jgi:hypothetical protein
MDINLHEWNDRQKTIIDDEAALFFQEVEIAVKMSKDAVFGQKNYLDLTKFVFTRAISTMQIKNEIMAYIANECPSSGNVVWDIEVKFLSEMNTIISNTHGNGGVYVSLNVHSGYNQYVQDYLIGS